MNAVLPLDPRAANSTLPSRLNSQQRKERNEHIFQLYLEGHTREEISLLVGLSYGRVKYIIQIDPRYIPLQEKRGHFHWSGYRRRRTPEEMRLYRESMETDPRIAKHLAAGIAEFRRMLEGRYGN